MTRQLIIAKAARLQREQREAREKAEAVPVESEPTVAEINFLYDSTNFKR